jgi:hypothetical protein
MPQLKLSDISKIVARLVLHYLVQYYQRSIIDKQDLPNAASKVRPTRDGAIDLDETGTASDDGDDQEHERPEVGGAGGARGVKGVDDASEDDGEHWKHGAWNTLTVHMISKEQNCL